MMLNLLLLLLLPDYVDRNSKRHTLEDLQYTYQSTDKNGLRDAFKELNVIRPVGSEAHTKVRTYITDYLRRYNWNVTLDSFQQATVIGPKTFHNIIARIGPPRDKDILLACHYESKLVDNFYGSCDSAMPCAMILLIAATVGPQIVQQGSDYGFRLVFFDGEEAFVSWTGTDSLYGARHLAQQWSDVGPDGRTELSKIELLVLLDLLGTKQSTIPNYKLADDRHYNTLAQLEKTMRQHDILRTLSAGNKSYFDQSIPRGGVQDDHIPFLIRGVPVLHMIPIPFPVHWHTVGDNATSIDWNSSFDMLNLIQLYMQDVLQLNDSN